MIYRFSVFLAFLFATTLLPAQSARVSADELLERLDRGQSIDVSDATVTGDFDLTKLRNRSVSRDGSDYRSVATVDQPMTFTNVVFKGDVLAYISADNDWGMKRKDTLYIAGFKEKVVFRNCRFERNAHFKYSGFEATADFSGSTFDEDALFKYVAFEEATDFSRVVFGEEANFKYTEFKEIVDFSGAKFREEGNFKYTEFKDGVNLNRAVFLDEADFKYTKFRSPATFEGTDWGRRADFKYTTIDGNRLTPSSSGR